MSSMMPILLAMDFMASTVSFTAVPPWVASTDDLDAMLSVTLAFSVFWVMLAVICSIDAVVSSTEAACSEDDCDRDCAVCETCAAALDSASAAYRKSNRLFKSIWGSSNLSQPGLGAPAPKNLPESPRQPHPGDASVVSFPPNAHPGTSYPRRTDWLVSTCLPYHATR